MLVMISNFHQELLIIKQKKDATVLIVFCSFCLQGERDAENCQSNYITVADDLVMCDLKQSLWIIRSLKTSNIEMDFCLRWSVCSIIMHCFFGGRGNRRMPFCPAYVHGSQRKKMYIV